MTQIVCVSFKQNYCTPSDKKKVKIAAVCVRVGYCAQCSGLLVV